MTLSGSFLITKLPEYFCLKSVVYTQIPEVAEGAKLSFELNSKPTTADLRIAAVGSAASL